MLLFTPAITKFLYGAQHDLQSIDKGNLYLGPFYIIDQIIGSIIIF